MPLQTKPFTSRIETSTSRVVLSNFRFEASTSRTATSTSQAATKDTAVVREPTLKEKIEKDPVLKRYRDDLFRKLVLLKRDVADKTDCMAYMICSNVALIDMATIRPKSLAELRAKDCKCSDLREF